METTGETNTSVMSIEKSLIVIQSKKKKKILTRESKFTFKPESQEADFKSKIRSKKKKKKVKEKWVKASKSDCINTLDYYLDLTFALHKEDLALSVFKT